MDKLDILAGIAEETKVASGTSSATVSVPAPGIGKQLVVVGFSISFGAASTAAGFADLSRTGVAIVREMTLPIGSMAPIIYEFKRPLYFGENEGAQFAIVGATNATIVAELYTCTRHFSGIVTSARNA